MRIFPVLKDTQALGRKSGPTVCPSGVMVACRHCVEQRDRWRCHKGHAEPRCSWLHLFQDSTGPREHPKRAYDGPHPFHVHGFCCPRHSPASRIDHTGNSHVSCTEVLGSWPHQLPGSEGKSNNDKGQKMALDCAETPKCPGSLLFRANAAHICCSMFQMRIL